jgi:hypothetical protein
MMYLLIIVAIEHFCGAAKGGNAWPLVCALIAGLLLLHRVWVRLHARFHRSDDAPRGDGNIGDQAPK